MYNNFNNGRTPYNNAQGAIYDPAYIAYLERENRLLKEQSIDPKLAEFKNTQEYKDREFEYIKAVLFDVMGAYLQNSPHRQEFDKWIKDNFEKYKKDIL